MRPLETKKPLRPGFRAWLEGPDCQRI